MQTDQKRHGPDALVRTEAANRKHRAPDTTLQTSNRPDGHPDPIELFKVRHGGKFTRSGAGERTNCPACDDKKGALAVSERDGWLHLYCFKCHESRVAILAAVGLRLQDVGPPRTWPASIEDARRARQSIKACGWEAALSVLAKESVVLHLVAVQLASGLPLDRDDYQRFALACTRVSKSALIMSAKENWKPDHCHAPSRLADLKREAVVELRRQLEQAEHELAEVTA